MCEYIAKYLKEEYKTDEKIAEFIEMIFEKVAACKLFKPFDGMLKNVKYGKLTSRKRKLIFNRK